MHCMAINTDWTPTGLGSVSPVLPCMGSVSCACVGAYACRSTSASLAVWPFKINAHTYNLAQVTWIQNDQLLDCWFFCSFYRPPACKIIKRMPNCIGSCCQCCLPVQLKSQCGCFCCVRETKNQPKSDALTSARMLDMLQWLLLSMSSKMPCRWTYIILCHKHDTSPKVWDLASNCPCSHDLWPSDGAEGGQTVSQLTVCYPCTEVHSPAMHGKQHEYCCIQLTMP
jgi:hypothetical protein